MKKVFLFRIKDSDGRDCCAYIEHNPLRFECGHYFGRVILHGSCYCNSDFPEYVDIETVLTQNEYEALIQFDKDIKELRFGIKEGDDRHQKGIELCKNIQYVYDKLNGEENEKFFANIQKSEEEIIKEQYSLTDEDIQEIWDCYGLEYRDRSVICAVYDDTDDLGYEEAYSMGYLDNEITGRYFDTEKFGQDLLENDGYIELSDGRVVQLSY